MRNFSLFFLFSVAAATASTTDTHHDDQARRVGVLLAPGFEMLDALGPYETWKEVQERYYSFVDIRKRTWQDDARAINSCAAGNLRVTVEFAWSAKDMGTTSAAAESIPSSSGVLIRPEFDISTDPDANHFDLLVIGAGVDGPDLRDYVRAHYGRGGLIMTVCTGVKLIADLDGWLDGKVATSNSLFLEGLMQQYPEVQWVSLADNLERRFVRSTAQITTTAGITAGIDGTLNYINQWCGAHVAEATRQCLEWPLHDRNNINQEGEIM